MTEIRTEYLARMNDDYTAAAVEFAFDLMQGDPDTFKAGYSLENASLAAHEVFRHAPRLVIHERLARRVGIVK